MQDNQQYWFPAKHYGWGWGFPTRWQGWAVLAIWSLTLIAGISTVGHAHPVTRAIFIGGMLLLMLLICYLKGEPPRWRRGE